MQNRAHAAGRAHDRTDRHIPSRCPLRWRTGELHGIERVYDGLRRWAVKQRFAEDRPALCRELSRLAKLYGILTGTAGPHADSRVERELQHLREMRIDVHRPLSLRLLDDASDISDASLTPEDLAKILAWIGTWTTRLWLADRPTAGMNTAVAELDRPRTRPRARMRTPPTIGSDASRDCGTPVWRFRATKWCGRGFEPGKAYGWKRHSVVVRDSVRADGG